MMELVLSLGSNIEPRKEYLRRGVGALRERFGEEVACSSVIETAAWGYESDNEFANMVLVFQCGLEPAEILFVIKEIEQAIAPDSPHRDACGGYQDRCLDIDIVYYGDMVYRSEALEIPHKDLHLRDFVLVPLMEVLPEKRHPVLGKTAEEMLRELRGGKVGESSDVPVLSVIIPAYNAGKTIEKCLQSIAVPVENRVEVIVVNDGSKDDTGSICREKQGAMPYLRVIDKENGGVSSARNMGLDAAIGEWVMFVDADDYLAAGYLEGLLEELRRGERGFDMFLTGCQTFGDKVGEMSLGENVLEIGGSEGDFMRLVDSLLIRTPWAKLFRRDVIEKRRLRFDERMRLAEDTVFVYSYLADCRRIKMLSLSGYCYNYRARNHYKLNKGEYLEHLEAVKGASAECAAAWQVDLMAMLKPIWEVLFRAHYGFVQGLSYKEFRRYFGEISTEEGRKMLPKSNFLKLKLFRLAMNYHFIGWATSRVYAGFEPLLVKLGMA